MVRRSLRRVIWGLDRSTLSHYGPWAMPMPNALLTIQSQLWTPQVSDVTLVQIL
jgi:hypothetical protein